MISRPESGGNPARTDLHGLWPAKTTREDLWPTYQFPIGDFGGGPGGNYLQFRAGDLSARPTDLFSRPDSAADGTPWHLP
jgi:hypothetical protein